MNNSVVAIVIISTFYCIYTKVNVSFYYMYIIFTDSNPCMALNNVIKTADIGFSFSVTLRNKFYFYDFT